MAVFCFTGKRGHRIKSRTVVTMALVDQAVIDHYNQVKFDLLHNFTDVRFDIMEVCRILKCSYSKMLTTWLMV